MSSGVALAQPGDPSALDVVTQAGLRALQERVKLRVVSVRRVRSQVGALRYPGARVERGYGWLDGSGRVLTASALVEGWSDVPGDRIEVTLGGTVHSVSQVRIDVRAGGAVLTLRGEVKALVANEEWAPPSDGDVWPGRALFTAGTATVAHRIVVGGKGSPPYQYYYTAAGHFPLGTPFTDGAGRLLTIVGNRHFKRPGTMYLLPPDGVRWFAELEEQTGEGK